MDNEDPAWAEMQVIDRRRAQAHLLSVEPSAARTEVWSAGSPVWSAGSPAAHRRQPKPPGAWLHAARRSSEMSVPGHSSGLTAGEPARLIRPPGRRV